MRFPQLYYTSCEQGLSGYAGYQFNAVTAGTSAETRRRVESLTGYEAPRSLAYADAPADLARCPVNLCYVPAPTMIVVNVQYVGRDASRRFGNYFAHAIEVPDGGLGELLPIELWRAPFWAAEQAPTRELPELAGPLQPGWLSPHEAGRFLAGHPHRERVTELISAAGRACAGDRAVLIVEDAADDVARWFAVISYLLPPPLIRQVSFATYLSRPSRSRLNLLGTISETDSDLGSDATENFCLFDFPGARFSGTPEHPLARLAGRFADRFGLPVMAELWGWTLALASGAERTLDDWHPVVAAAAALGQSELEAADVAAVVGWLERAESVGHLPGARQQEIAWVLFGGAARERSQLAVLKDVAGRTGDHALREQVECELIEADMRDAMSGTGPAACACPIAAGPVRDRVSARCQEAVAAADSGAVAIRLLAWADSAGLKLNSEVVIRSTRAVIAPWLAADLPGRPLAAAVRAEATALAGRSQQFRRGLVVYLTGLLDSGQAGLSGVLAGLVGDLVTDEDLHAHSGLREQRLISQRRGTPVEILARIAAIRSDGTVDERLLKTLWPSGLWSRDEAIAVLDRLDLDQLGADVLVWFTRAADSDLESADIASHVRLCDRLLGLAVRMQLAPPQRARLAAALALHRLAVGKNSTWPELAAGIAEHAGLDCAPVRTVLRDEVAAALADADPYGDVLGLVETLDLLDEAALVRYVSRLRRGLTSLPSSLMAVLSVPSIVTVSARLSEHLAALWLHAGPQPGPRLQDALDDLFGLVERGWQRKHLMGVARLMEPIDPPAAAEFKAIVDDRKLGRVRRGARRMTHAVARTRRRVRAPRQAPPSRAGGEDDIDDPPQDGPG